MGRFDSMISKGVNTYDADATDADIMVGKTAYVAGVKVTGTATPGGGVPIRGTDIDVEAITSVAKGDKIVGVENTGSVTPTYSGTTQSYTIAEMSKDGSVAVLEPTSQVVTDGITISFVFRNETGQYGSQFDLTLYNIPYTLDTTSQRLIPILNEDGTLGLWSDIGVNSKSPSGSILSDCSGRLPSYVIIINIDKDNKTASYSYQTDISSLVKTEYPSATQVYNYLLSYPVIKGNLSTDYENCMRIFGDYVVCPAFRVLEMITNNSSTSYSSSQPGYICVFKIINNSLVLQNQLDAEYYQSGASYEYLRIASLRPSGQIDDDNLLINFTARGSNSILPYLSKYNISTNRFTVTNQVEIHTISENCRYGIYLFNNTSCRIKQININDLTLTDVKTVYGESRSSGRHWVYGVNNDCSAYYCNSISNIASVENSTSSSASKLLNNVSAGYKMLNWYLDSNVIRGVNSPTYYEVVKVPSTNAAYLISSTTSDAVESGKIYGIATDDLSIGQRGTAKKLFSTMT